MGKIKSAVAGLSLGIASLGLSILPAANAYATVITYEFVGTVSLIQGTPSGLVANFGDQVTGSFSYDDTVADTSAFDSLGIYPQSIFQGIIFSLNANNLVASEYDVQTSNNPGTDTVKPVASGAVHLNDVLDAALRIGIDFQDTTAVFLPDDGLPSTLLPFSSFDIRSGFIQNTDTLDLIRFDIVSLTTAVPEPATLALFGIGVAALGFARRRKMA